VRTKIVVDAKYGNGANSLRSLCIYFLLFSNALYFIWYDMIYTIWYDMIY